MGTSSGHGHSIPTYMMRAFAFVLLAVASAYAEADADAYTIGQVNHGFTHGGIITGVDYGHGAVSGVGAIGNRYAVPVVNHATYAGPYAAGVYSGVHGVYGGIHSGVHGVHAYGKREAEADTEADPHFYNGVYGTGVYGHHAGVVSTHSVVPTVHSTVAAVPAVHTGVYSGVHGVSSIYNRGIYGLYGKREAEAEAEPYTIGQVAHGLPIHNAYATGHPHNAGFTNYISHGYGGYPHVGYNGHYFG